MNDRCSVVREQIADRSVEADTEHLERCAECAAVAAALDDLDRELGSLPRQLPSGSLIDETAMMLIEVRKPVTAPPSRSTPGRFAGAGIAASALLLCLLLLRPVPSVHEMVLHLARSSSFLIFELCATAAGLMFLLSPARGRAAAGAICFFAALVAGVLQFLLR